jgi:hypothetical protein
VLPAAYQLPAAAILIAGGVLACFAGYRLFRVVLGLYGFLLGALLASSLMSPGDHTQMVVGALVGGIVGAVVLNLAYFVGVALVGAAGAAVLLHVAWTRVAHGDPPVLLVIAVAVAGALAATQLQRIVIIAATAFGGAWTAVVGVLAVLGDRSARAAAAANDVWVAYPLSAGPHRYAALGGWLVLSIAGLAVQLRGKAKKGKAKPAKKARSQKA